MTEKKEDELFGIWIDLNDALTDLGTIIEQQEGQDTPTKSFPKGTRPILKHCKRLIHECRDAVAELRSTDEN